MTIKTSPFAIVTDSTADIPIDTTESLNISVIPAVLTLDGETYLDGLDISRAEFYQRMPNLRTPPTTAVPSVLVFEETYQHLLESGVERILSIHLSSNLSGIVDTAKQAAYNFDDRVKVFDSGQLSMGVGFQAIEAAQAVIRANIGDFLQIKQLVEVKDGLVNALARTRTYTKAFEQLITIASTWINIEHLAVLHSGAPERAEELTERVAGMCPNPLMIVDITTTIGVHVGPDCVGLAVLTHD
jgi:fatty acid-binding protein DegV